jgi:hypothetical protein
VHEGDIMPATRGATPSFLSFRPAGFDPMLITGSR